VRVDPGSVDPLRPLRHSVLCAARRKPPCVIWARKNAALRTSETGQSLGKGCAPEHARLYGRGERVQWRCAKRMADLHQKVRSLLTPRTITHNTAFQDRREVPGRTGEYALANLGRPFTYPFKHDRPACLSVALRASTRAVCRSVCNWWGRALQTMRCYWQAGYAYQQALPLTGASPPVYVLRSALMPLKAVWISILLRSKTRSGIRR